MNACDVINSRLEAFKLIDPKATWGVRPVFALYGGMSLLGVSGSVVTRAYVFCCVVPHPRAPG